MADKRFAVALWEDVGEAIERAETLYWMFMEYSMNRREAHMDGLWIPPAIRWLQYERIVKAASESDALHSEPQREALHHALSSHAGDAAVHAVGEALRTTFDFAEQILTEFGLDRFDSSEDAAERRQSQANALVERLKSAQQGLERSDPDLRAMLRAKVLSAVQQWRAGELPAHLTDTSASDEPPDTANVLSGLAAKTFTENDKKEIEAAMDAWCNLDNSWEIPQLKALTAKLSTVAMLYAPDTCTRPRDLFHMRLSLHEVLREYWTTLRVWPDAKQWEAETGRPYPRDAATLHDYMKLAGVPLETILHGDWLPCTVGPILFAALQRIADEQATQPENGSAADDRAPPVECLVTLQQAAAMVSRSKKTLERRKGEMPAPRVQGGGGKPDEWAWSELRPWLEKEFDRPLPERFPASRLPGDRGQADGH